MIPGGKASGSPEPQGPETESAAGTCSWEGRHQRGEKNEASRSTEGLWVAAGSGPISGMVHTICRRAMLASRIQVGWFGGVHEERAKTASNEDLGILSPNTPLHTLSLVNASFLWTSRKSACWFRGRWGRACNDVSHFLSSGEIVLIFPSFQHHDSQALCLLTSHPTLFPLPLCRVQGLWATFPCETLLWHLEMAACIQRTVLGLLTLDIVPLTTLHISHSKALLPRRILRSAMSRRNPEIWVDKSSPGGSGH